MRFFRMSDLDHHLSESARVEALNEEKLGNLREKVERQPSRAFRACSRVVEPRMASVPRVSQSSGPLRLPR
jgi:hypothetical protein